MIEAEIPGEVQAETSAEVRGEAIEADGPADAAGTMPALSFVSGRMPDVFFAHGPATGPVRGAELRQRPSD